MSVLSLSIDFSWFQTISVHTRVCAHVHQKKNVPPTFTFNLEQVLDWQQLCILEYKIILK